MNKVGLMSKLVLVPLGVSTGRILDVQMTSSSVIDVYHVVNQAKLHRIITRFSHLLIAYILLSSFIFAPFFRHKRRCLVAKAT